MWVVGWAAATPGAVGWVWSEGAWWGCVRLTRPAGGGRPLSVHVHDWLLIRRTGRGPTNGQGGGLALVVDGWRGVIDGLPDHATCRGNIANATLAWLWKVGQIEGMCTLGLVISN